MASASSSSQSQILMTWSPSTTSISCIASWVSAARRAVDIRCHENEDAQPPEAKTQRMTPRPSAMAPSERSANLSGHAGTRLASTSNRELPGPMRRVLRVRPEVEVGPRPAARREPGKQRGTLQPRAREPRTSDQTKGRRRDQTTGLTDIDQRTRARWAPGREIRWPTARVRSRPIASGIFDGRLVHPTTPRAGLLVTATSFRAAVRGRG